MYFKLSVMLGFAGLMIASFLAIIPMPVPIFLRAILFIFGAVLLLVGNMMLGMRLEKTGLIHLVKPGNPQTVNWIYVRKDGTIEIKPSMRKTGGFLYDKGEDIHVPDLRAYTLSDHQIRFVLEDTGKVSDLDYCVYASVLKHKYGFVNIRDMFNKLLTSKGNYPVSEEFVARHTIVSKYNELKEQLKQWEDRAQAIINREKKQQQE